MIPLYHYVANDVRPWYYHCKFFATGVNFDKDGIEKKLAREGGDVWFLWFLWYLQILCVLSVSKKV